MLDSCTVNVQRMKRSRHKDISRREIAEFQWSCRAVNLDSPKREQDDSPSWRSAGRNCSGNVSIKHAATSRTVEYVERKRKQKEKLKVMRTKWSLVGKSKVIWLMWIASISITAIIENDFTFTEKTVMTPAQLGVGCYPRWVGVTASSTPWSWNFFSFFAKKMEIEREY